MIKIYKNKKKKLKSHEQQRNPYYKRSVNREKLKREKITTKSK